eukprot:132528_1
MAEMSVGSEKEITITAPRFRATSKDITKWKKNYSDIFVGNKEDLDKKFASRTKLDEWLKKLEKWSVEHGGFWHDDNPYCKLKWVKWYKHAAESHINIRRNAANHCKSTSITFHTINIDIVRASTHQKGVCKNLIKTRNNVKAKPPTKEQVKKNTKRDKDVRLLRRVIGKEKLDEIVRSEQRIDVSIEFTIPYLETLHFKQETWIEHLFVDMIMDLLQLAYKNENSDIKQLLKYVKIQSPVNLF